MKVSRILLSTSTVALSVVLLLPARFVHAQTTTDTDVNQTRGERMMEYMMGTDNADRVQQTLTQQYGTDFVDSMYKAMGQYGLENEGRGWYGMPMMAGWWGSGAGGSVLGAVWSVIWTINSVLIGVLLWTLIRRFRSPKK